MKRYTINEAARLTGIPRSRVQQAVMTNSVEYCIETLPSMKTRYLIPKYELDKLRQMFDKEMPLAETLPSKMKKSRESAADVISGEIRRKLEIMREERELDQAISGY